MGKFDGEISRGLATALCCDQPEIVAGRHRHARNALFLVSRTANASHSRIHRQLAATSSSFADAVIIIAPARQGSGSRSFRSNLSDAWLVALIVKRDC